MPTRDFRSGNDPGPAFDEFEWFDGWCEAYQQLLEARDFAGLIGICEERVEKFPEEPQALEALAIAHLEAGQPQQAIVVVEDHYLAEPDSPLYQAVIADALRAQGKSLEAFSWIEPPRLVRLDSVLLDRLFRFLKPKRKPRHLSCLWVHTMELGYPFFGERDLLDAMLEDGRFQIEDPEAECLAKVSICPGTPSS